MRELVLVLFLFFYVNLAPAGDLREDTLRAFFASYNPHVEYLAPVYIEVADAHGLDWRLLPALSIVESSAGKHCRGNNMFGWASGKATFASKEAAIRTVGMKLATLSHYKGKTLEQKLKTYNPYAGYTTIVKKTMRRISSASSFTGL